MATAEKRTLPGYKYVSSQYEAVAWAEGFEDPPCEEAAIEAWQYLVDTGLAWQLQGWFGRQATALIDAGIIHK